MNLEPGASVAEVSRWSCRLDPCEPERPQTLSDFHSIEDDAGDSDHEGITSLR